MKLALDETERKGVAYIAGDHWRKATKELEVLQKEQAQLNPWTTLQIQSLSSVALWFQVRLSQA